MLNLISKSLFFPQHTLLRAVICKKGVLCSRIKFIQVTFKSILTWEGNSRYSRWVFTGAAGTYLWETDPSRWATRLKLFLKCFTFLSLVTVLVECWWSTKICNASARLTVFEVYREMCKLSSVANCIGILQLLLVKYLSLQLLLHLEVIGSFWVLQTGCGFFFSKLCKSVSGVLLL